MSDATWNSISDDQPLTQDDQIRVNITFDCKPLSSISAGDIQSFVNQQQAVKSVLEAKEGWQDWVTIWDPFTCRYSIILNPQPGTTAGDVRNAVYTALAKANATHTIKSQQILVGLIERQANLGLVGAIADKLSPGPSTAITFAAVAVVAVVVLVIFTKLD